MRIPARFSGKCAKCSKPIQAGEEIEYADKKAYHPNCYEAGNLFTADDADALARRLGFIGPDEPIPASWNCR